MILRFHIHNLCVFWLIFINLVTFTASLLSNMVQSFTLSLHFPTFYCISLHFSTFSLSISCISRHFSLPISCISIHFPYIFHTHFPYIFLTHFPYIFLTHFPYISLHVPYITLFPKFTLPFLYIFQPFYAFTAFSLLFTTFSQYVLHSHILLAFLPHFTFLSLNSSYIFLAFQYDSHL